jgi:hypothetical protein
MGARDLIDILRTVPGFDFGTDVKRRCELYIIEVCGFRKGKAFTYDRWSGYKCNLCIPAIILEIIFHDRKTFKNRNIERVLGSATYGDCAEMVVINIITTDYKSKIINAGALFHLSKPAFYTEKIYSAGRVINSIT